jgi:peptide/nickel transport system substrate-binding protein
VKVVRTRWLVGSILVALVAVGVAYATLGRDQDTNGEATSGTARIQQGGTLRFAAGDEPSGFNINTSRGLSTALQNIVVNLYPSVFRTHPDLIVRLDQTFMDSAELTNQNPQTVTYKIKQNATWSDGTPVTADDFAYLWSSCNGKNQDIDCLSTVGYQDIRSVSGTGGDKTVTVVFKTPFADWRSLFTNILPSHYVKAQRGGWNSGLAKDPERISSGGPFRIASWSEGQSLTLERNERYWGPRAPLDRIVFRLIPDPAAQVEAFQGGEVDLIYPRPQVDLVRRVQRLPGVRSQLSFGLSFEHLDFNLHHPILADLRVRRAIALAINQRQLLDRTVGLLSDQAQVLGNRIWLTGQPHYEDHAGGHGKGDLQAATRLLEQAGWRRGADGVYAKDGRPLRLRYSTITGERTRESVGVLLQAQLKRAGIDLRIANAPAATLFAEWLPDGNFDIAEFAWIGTPFAVSSNPDIYGTKGSLNYGGLSDPTVDALFRQATAELDPERAAGLANQIDRELWRTLPTIPLFQRASFIAWRDTLVNVGDNPTAEGLFWNAGTWGYTSK